MRSIVVVMGLLVSACPTVEASCGPDTCLGCCTNAGECRHGDDVLACGSAGTACDICVGAQRCEGRCVSPPVVTDTDAGSEQDAGLADAGTVVDAGGLDAGVVVDAGPGTVTLRLDFTGTGQGALETSQGVCTQGCDQTFPASTSVTVQARTPSGRSRFAGFSACPGTVVTAETCRVSLTVDTRVAARFDAVPSPANVVSPVSLWNSASQLTSAVAAHPTSGILTAVSTNGTVTFGATGFNESVLTRFSPSGAVLRSFSLAGVKVLGLALAADGSAWLGATLSSNNAAGGPLGGAVLHLTAQDVVDLVIPLGPARATSLALSPSGAVAVGGLVTGAFPASITPMVIGSQQAGDDAFALELSSAGQIVHAWRVGGAFAELSASVLFDASGRLTLVSTLQATITAAGVTVPGARYLPAVAVLRFDAAGSVERAFALTAPGSNGQVRAHHAIAFGSGVAIVGSSVGTPAALGRTSEGQAGFVALLDSNLALAWVKGSTGTPDTGWLTTAGSTLVVTTEFGLVGSWTNTNYMGNSAFESNTLLARFSDTGAVLGNQRIIGSVGAPQLASLGAQVVALGSFTSGLEFAPQERAVTPYLDLWLAVLAY